jgi:hypothetical protein
MIIGKGFGRKPYLSGICPEVVRKTWQRVLRHEQSLNAGIVGSNPTQDIDVCIYSVFILSFVGSVPATGLFPVQGVLPTVYRIKKLKIGQGPTTVEP